MQVKRSSDQRFTQDARRRTAARQRMRLVKWLAFLIVLAAFYYYVGHGLVLRAIAKTKQDAEQWQAGTSETFRHIQERESIGGQQRPSRRPGRR
jgi:hypothetical protein